MKTMVRPSALAFFLTHPIFAFSTPQSQPHRAEWPFRWVFVDYTSDCAGGGYSGLDDSSPQIVAGSSEPPAWLSRPCHEIRRLRLPGPTSQVIALAALGSVWVWLRVVADASRLRLPASSLS